MVCILLLIFTNCGGGGDYSNDESTEEETDEVVAEESAFSGNTVISVTHEVEDYAVWVAAYNEASNPEARISHFVNVDNPKEIVVFELTESHEAGIAGMKSEEIKSAMEKAGVTSEPVIFTADIKYMNTDETEEKYRVMITHEVSDYDTWKEKFDADKGRRDEAGLTLSGLGTDSENGNLVTIVFSTNDLETAREMTSSPNLKEVMEEAGVISEPIIKFLMVPDSN